MSGAQRQIERMARFLLQFRAELRPAQAICSALEGVDRFSGFLCYRSAVRKTAEVTPGGLPLQGVLRFSAIAAVPIQCRMMRGPSNLAGPRRPTAKGGTQLQGDLERADCIPTPPPPAQPAPAGPRRPRLPPPRPVRRWIAGWTSEELVRQESDSERARNGQACLSW